MPAAVTKGLLLVYLLLLPLLRTVSFLCIFCYCRCYERSPSCLSSFIAVVTNCLLLVYLLFIAVVSNGLLAGYRLQLPLLRTVSLLVDFFKIMLEIYSITTKVVCYDTVIR
jgi:hypothetical protein